MNRSVTILSVLLVVSMLAAYFSWTHDTTGEEDKGVVVVDVAPTDLKGIRFESEDFSIVLTAKEDALGKYTWAETVRTIQPATKPNGEPAGEATTRKLSFKAAKQGDVLFEDMAPFRAIRQLENVGEANLDEFGLKTPEASFALETTAGTRAFDVGKEGYGHRQYYLRDKDSGKIFLVDGTQLRAIRRGDNRLPERSLVQEDMREIQSVAVKSGDVDVAYEHRNASDPAKAFWAKPGSDEKDITAKTWIEKLMRMRSIGYADSDLDASSLEVAVSVEVTAEKQKTRIELLRGADKDGAEAWYGRSEFTRGLVKLPLALAGDLAPDVVTLIGLEPPPKPEPAKPPASAPTSSPSLPIGLPMKAADPKSGTPDAAVKPADPAPADDGHGHAPSPK